MSGTQFYPLRALKATVRRQAKRLSAKLYRVSSNYGVAHHLYLAEARYFAWLCGQPWAQQRFWASEVEMMQRFLRETNILKLNQKLEPKAIVHQALLGDTLHKRWLPWFNRFQPSQLASITTVRGQENFTTAYQQKCGIILTYYHGLASRFVLPWTTSVGVKPHVRIEPARVVANAAGLTYSPTMDAFLNARQLHAAKACLAEAGVVHILQDGLSGKTGVLLLPFLQRLRPFRTSFAELALLTGAVVLPVSAILDRQGIPEITFYPSFDVGDEAQPKSERIEQMVKQYAGFLETEWVETPGNIRLLHIKDYLHFLAQGLAEEN